MHLTYIFLILAAIGLFGCSHVQDFRRIPASMIDDVGIIGPSGEVLLYYKEGGYIIVKACEPNTILGSTPAVARKNCKGKSNKVPVETFKESIRNLVSIDRLNVLKPLTPGEVNAFSKEGSNLDQYEAMMNELKKINNFIAVYGEENADIVRKEELEKALRSQETRVSAIKKIQTEIEKALNLIADQSKLTLSKFSSDKDKFLYTVLKQFNPNEKFPCGLTGSVEERINDCSYQPTSSTENFVLVTRSKDFKEVHKELATDLLWSDRLPSTMNPNRAKKACKADLNEVAGISDVTWRLPSKEEYKQAYINGIHKALPNMNHWFWASSLDWLLKLDGKDGYYFNTYSSWYSVRCVARDEN